MKKTECKERRRFHRIIFDAPAIIESNSESYHTTLLDISLKGALARIPENWQPQPGERVTLKVMLDDGESISMLTSCAHVENGRLGLLCEEIDMISISMLRRLVELNICDEILLQRDLEALG
jgi:c-di-GMP-binding flagellar brake protein YcgR